MKPSDFQNCYFIQLRLRERAAFCYLRIEEGCSKGLMNRVFNRPPPTYSISENVVADPGFLRQRHHGHFFATIFENMITPTIVCLLGICSPAAIIRFVVSAVVNPVKGVAGAWFVPHVEHETLKPGELATSSPPPLTHRNASSSVVGVFGMILISASIYHPGPLSVCWVPSVGRLVKRGYLNNVFSGLAHVTDGLSSSAGQSLQRLASAPKYREVSA